MPAAADLNDYQDYVANDMDDPGAPLLHQVEEALGYMQRGEPIPNNDERDIAADIAREFAARLRAQGREGDGGRPDPDRAAKYEEIARAIGNAPVAEVRGAPEPAAPAPPDGGLDRPDFDVVDEVLARRGMADDRGVRERLRRYNEDPGRLAPGDQRKLRQDIERWGLLEDDPDVRARFGKVAERIRMGEALGGAPAASGKGDRDYLNDVLDGLGAADPGLRRLLDAYNKDVNALPDDRRNALAQIIDNIARDEAPEADKQRLRDIADRIGRQEPLQGRPATPEPAADGIGTQERLDVWAMMVEGDIQRGGPDNLARVREALEKMQRGENVDGVEAAVAAAAARALAKRKDNAGRAAQAAQYRALADAIRKAGDAPPDTAEQRRRRRAEREPSPATPPGERFFDADDRRFIDDMRNADFSGLAPENRRALEYMVKAFDAVQNGDDISDDELWAGREGAARMAGVNRGNGALTQAARYENIKDGLEEALRRRGSQVPAPAPAPPAPKLPTIDEADKRFVQVRGRLRAENMDVIDEINAGKIPDREKLEGAIADLDKMIERYNRRGRAEKLGQAQRIKNALEQVLAEADAREQAEREAVTPEGRTQAVENIADAIADRAAELRKNRERAKAKKIEDAADDLADALDRAEEAHNAGNKEDRDAALLDADDAAAVFEAEGENVIGDQVKRDIQGNRNRFSEDDNRVPPMERQEGIDRVADKWEEVGRKLRAEGAAGRKKRREYQDYMDEFDDAIDEAEAENRRKDENARDQNLKNAERMVEQVRQLDPELADVMEEVLAGQRQRILDSSAGGEAPDVLGDSPRAAAVRALSDAIKASGLNMQQLRSAANKTKRGEELLPGFKYVKNQSGGINARNGTPVVEDADGRRFLIKHDNDYGDLSGNGSRAEEEVARLYRALGFAQPMVLKPHGDSDDPWLRDMFIMEFNTPEMLSEQLGVEIVSVGDGDAMPAPGPNAPQELKEMFLQAAVANMILAQTDRHGGNYMYAKDRDGNYWPVIIDNGLMMMNAAFGRHFSSTGKPGDYAGNIASIDWSNSRLFPNKFVDSATGNTNQIAKKSAGFVRELGVAEAEKFVQDFLARMKARAEVLEFADPATRDFVLGRLALADSPGEIRRILDAIKRY